MRNKYKVGILLLIAIILFLTYNILLRNQESYALSRYGSRGDEVKQIQTKLKNWGYYSGSVDGIYGSATLSAVKYFQRKNGLTADGIAGTKTLQALGIYNSLTEEDITKGKNIIGTGTIDVNGNIGEIGGVKYKLIGAVRNKADIFICPKENEKEAKKVAKENNYDIIILTADNLAEIIQKLENI